ncbi:ABC transporter ATP-binding protein [Kitasatospora sp. SUK 42]|uniref:ABC transporter ATP-binding protein n=1 Tax=Kitasatospora sp. SUK 42 TaxID=1588882 RepID=UPI0018CACE9E|nr:ABC transporter ATP-binding protein [Kitasatospora sp. SUK 42]MBV2156447.1 ABC transporter ATP-binding protein/permease [Kitasatospora sp. SUK 42]
MRRVAASGGHGSPGDGGIGDSGIPGKQGEGTAIDRAPETDAQGPVADSPAIPVGELLRRFWPWVRPDVRWLPLSAVLLVLGAFGEVVSVWLFKDLIDDVLVPREFADFWPLAGAMLGAAVAAALLTFAGTYTSTRTAERYMLRLRTDTLAHLHTLPPDTLEIRWRGDLVARMTSDIAAIEQLVATGMVEGAVAGVSLLLFTGAAFYLSWPLTVAALLAAPLFILATGLFGRRIRIRERQVQRRAGGVTALLEESLRNVVVARSYGQEHREVERVHREGLALLDAELASARVADLYQPFLSVLELLAALVVVGVGAYEVIHGNLSLGGLLAFAAFMAQLFEPVQQLSGLIPLAGAAGASGERVLELHDMTSPVREGDDARDPGPVRGRVTFDGVRAAYPVVGGGSGPPVLTDLAFDLSPGETLAVIGPSGSGKSTLAKLLVRFLDPEAGTISLDGHDTRGLTLAALRQAVTLLPQQAPLFHATIADNIAYGRPDAPRADIEGAARAAGAHGFVTALPDGYGTVIGADGFQLSGGQSQRIAIARAFLRDTPVLVLDEPTTGLDPRTVQQLIPPLRRLMSGRTTILITHDPTLLPLADHVLTLEPPAPVRGRKSRRRGHVLTRQAQ